MDRLQNVGWRFLILGVVLVICASWAVPAQAVLLPGGTPDPAYAGLQVWLKADAGVYKDAGVTPAGDGDAVVQWNDQSSNSNHASRIGTNGNMTYETVELGGKPVVSFTDSSGADYLRIPSYQPADNDNLTVFVVSRADPQTLNGSAIHPLVGSGNPANGGGAFTISTMRPNAGGPGNLGYFGRGYNPFPYDEYTKDGDPSNFGDGQGHGIVLQLSGASGNGTFRGYYDAEAREAHNGSTSNPANGPVEIGGSSTDNSRRLAGDIAEVLIYDEALSISDRNGVTDYLGQKYGLFSPPVVDVPTGLMLHATMDNSDIDATTVYDVSGNMRHGTLQNGLSQSGDAGQIDEALDFADGANDTNGEYVDLSSHVGDFAGLAEGTISAWIRSDDYPDGPAVILAASDKDDGSSELRFFVQRNSATGDVVRFGVRNDGATLTDLIGITDVGDGLMHHVAISVDATGKGTLYVDGLPDAFDTSVDFFDDIAGLDTMGIGRNKDTTAGGGQWFFGGLIDDLGIWSRALNIREIEQIYTQGLAGISALRPTIIPEPSGFVIALGLLALGLFGWRRRR